MDHPIYIPDIAVGVNEHHDCPDGAAGLEEEDPAAVEEEEDGEAELYRVTGGLDGVEVIIMSDWLLKLYV